MNKLFKKFVPLLVIIVMCISISSCERVTGDIAYQNLHDSERSALLYQDTLYYSTDDWFTLWTTEDDLELGQYYSFPFSTNIYSYTTDAPLYLWESRCVGDYAFDVYLKEEYNFQKQKYILNDTGIEVYFFDEITRLDYDVPTDDWIKSSDALNLYLSNNARLKINLEIILAEDGNYYIFKDGAWKLSEHFVNILKDNSIITE